MPFRVKDTIWLSTEVERVKSIILTPRYWGMKWTQARLREALGDIGLEYTPAQIDLLNGELHRLGVVEDVG